ncbi:hypothetical protein ASPZODRAFT_20332 [Penicilliopsis zonata CBS 506.65]|uniref:C2H2-type domain-containing protein n=1 Tax=Penicilliopsis zonata CBS 506.65 TaxID=1073090 RepID=A0A1L9S5X3_9EURO|nr:hypothetical protein ASPZODRAFT_20332 [Penicilliopsis zonata CBS 506.65]OJJ42562.1 hypothetical protein ASPZODRAFT_20332 [Penicilliopsis zonata CBS 506.65]
MSLDRHACHCGKSFARKEHLTRHQATHEQLAYGCEVCQRRFSRKELLRRHAAVHELNYTRAVVSCNACHANKTKCSGGPRCSLCARRGINCTFQRGTTESASSFPARDEWLLNLSIIPSKQIYPGDLEALSPGMEAIHQVLVAEKPSSLEEAIQESDEWREWRTRCMETYFQCFHLRWPILNAPSFDLTTASLSLTASVCVIGTQLQKDSRSTERLWADQVHDLLLEQLLRALIDPGLMPQGQAWPIDLFQAVLLTLVFSLYRTDESVLSSAMLLRATFISRLREIGAFNAEQLVTHLQTHFSGTYAPYTLSMREKFRRLLALTYQFDAYFALAYGQPPILHRQEVRVHLPTTFALWNAHGLDIFAQRLPEEPAGRSGFLISEMTQAPSSFAASQLLVEDIILGLCGIVQSIWIFRHEEHHHTLQKALLIDTLEIWKSELGRINDLAKTETITSDVAKYLLLAYRGEDESIPAILKRITSLVQDGMVLSLYLEMYLQQNDEGLDGFRSALRMHMNDSMQSFSPLIRHALAMAERTQGSITSD